MYYYIMLSDALNMCSNYDRSLQPAGPLSAVAAEKEAAHTHSAHTSFCPDTCRSIQVQRCHNLEAPF